MTTNLENPRYIVVDSEGVCLSLPGRCLVRADGEVYLRSGERGQVASDADWRMMRGDVLEVALVEGRVLCAWAMSRTTLRVVAG